MGFPRQELVRKVGDVAKREGIAASIVYCEMLLEMFCRRSAYFNILRVFIAILQWGLPGCACRFEQTLRGSVHKGEKYGKNPGCRKSIIQKFKIIEIAFPLKPIYNKSRKYLWRYLP